MLINDLYLDQPSIIFYAFASDSVENQTSKCCVESYLNYVHAMAPISWRRFTVIKYLNPKQLIQTFSAKLGNKWIKTIYYNLPCDCIRFCRKARPPILCWSLPALLPCHGPYILKKITQSRTISTPKKLIIVIKPAPCKPIKIDVIYSSSLRCIST